MEEKNSLLKTKERVDHRLKKNKHFSYIYKKGKKTNSNHFTLFSVPSKYRAYKLGISVSKKLGKANVRNKLKRRIKEIIRLGKLPKDNFNYVILARDGAQNLTFDEIQKELIGLFA